MPQPGATPWPPWIRYLRDRFAVHVIDIGKAVNLNDRRVCYEGLHPTPAGNVQVADRLAPEIERVMLTWP